MPPRPGHSSGYPPHGLSRQPVYPHRQWLEPLTQHRNSVHRAMMAIGHGPDLVPQTVHDTSPCPESNGNPPCRSCISHRPGCSSGYRRIFLLPEIILTAFNSMPDPKGPAPRHKASGRGPSRNPSVRHIRHGPDKQGIARAVWERCWGQ